MVVCRFISFRLLDYIRTSLSSDRKFDYELISINGQSSYTMSRLPRPSWACWNFHSFTGTVSKEELIYVRWSSGFRWSNEVARSREVMWWPVLRPWEQSRDVNTQAPSHCTTSHFHTSITPPTSVSLIRSALIILIRYNPWLDLRLISLLMSPPASSPKISNVRLLNVRILIQFSQPRVQSNDWVQLLLVGLASLPHRVSYHFVCSIFLVQKQVSLVRFFKINIIWGGSWQQQLLKARFFGHGHSI